MSVPLDALTAALQGMARDAVSGADADTILRGLAERAVAVLGVDGAGVLRVRGSGAGEHLAVVAATDTAVDRLERAQRTLPDAHGPTAARRGAPVVVEDLGAGDVPGAAAASRLGGLAAVVSVPLVARDRTWAVLDLYRAVTGPWSEEDLMVARLLAGAAASYVVMAADREDAAAVRRELEYRHLHDELTGLPNRTLLFDRLEHALDVAGRRGQVVAVMFIDLDGFKAVNDTHGHAAGDAVLRELSERMSAAVRLGDTLARLSGDEFVVVCEDLPSVADAQRAVDVVSERLLSAIARPIPVGDVDLHVRASVGVAFSTDHATPDALLHAADAAMYLDKRGDERSA